MVVDQVAAVFKVTFVPHLLPHITGKAPEIEAGVLNQGEGAKNSGGKAGPTEPTLTTVPLIRNEMANENSETTPERGANCGGHLMWGGCSECPKKAPNKQARWLFNSSPYQMFSTTLKGDVFKIKHISLKFRPYYCNGDCKWVLELLPTETNGKCVHKNSTSGVTSRSSATFELQSLLRLWQDVSQKSAKLLTKVEENSEAQNFQNLPILCNPWIFSAMALAMSIYRTLCVFVSLKVHS